MRLEASEGVHLTELAGSDAEAITDWLAEPEISRWTMRIPFPYSRQDAEAFLAIVRGCTAEAGRPVQFAVRREDERLIGIVGIDNWRPGRAEAELGYWLAKPYWGKGIMTSAVEAVVRLAFEEYRIPRLTAHVFVGNAGSARVLEKAGFVNEATLPGFHEKAGRKLDAWRFAKLSRLPYEAYC